MLAELVGHELALPPGRALDLGAGTGGDALWLGSLGWEVTAADVSATAVRRIQALVDDRGLTGRVRPVRRDLARTLPLDSYDLIYACYFHAPTEIGRPGILRAAAELSVPGGHLVIVDHASTAPWSWGDPDTVHPTPEQTWAEIGLAADWEPVQIVARRREATGPAGEVAVVTDNILVARRVAERAFSARAERAARRQARRRPDLWG